jgi:hypothetical protein
MTNLKKHPLYIQWMDEIDPTLSKVEKNPKQFAKFASLLPGYLGWAMMAIIFLGSGYILDSMTPGTVLLRTMQWVTDTISKSARIVWYYIFFYPAKLIYSVIENTNR